MNIVIYSKLTKNSNRFRCNYWLPSVTDRLNSGFYYIVINKLIQIGKKGL